jgi:methyl-accepting chemotaxis protein
MLLIKKWSLVRQLSLGVFVLIALVISALLAVSTSQSKALMLSQLKNEQQQLVSVLSAQLNATHASILLQTERLERTFLELYSGDLVFDNQQTMKVADVESPVVSHLGEVVNLNFDKVDQFSRMTGGNATVFIRINDDFLRITTSLTNNRGERTVGTFLNRDHPGYQSVLAGQAYIGEAHLFGTDYMTKYTPVKDNQGKTIAILYVGLPISDVMGDLRKNLLAQKIGETGYLALLDVSIKNKEKLLVHHEYEGQLFNKAYAGEIDDVKSILSKSEGRLSFQSNKSNHKNAEMNFKESGDGNWVVYSVSYLDEFIGPLNNLLVLLVSISILATLVLVALLSLLLKKSLAPVANMRDVLYQVGQGDLTHRFVATEIKHSENELDQLQGSINSMLEQFSSVITGVRDTSEGISNDSHHVSDVSNKMLSLSRSSSDETVQVTEAIGEMAKSIEEVSKSAVAVSQDASNTVALSADGSEVMSMVNTKISSLQQEFQQAVAAVEQLRDDSNEIGKVVEVISSVAEQTNLLALNAAIEAARAGEQGRGFAVVADEVRTLAQRTQQSTQEIQQVVVTLQENAQKASSRMESGVVQIHDSVAEVERADNVLVDLKQAAQQVSHHMDSVATATEEQSAAAVQISGSSSSLKASALQTSDCAEESAQVGENMAEQAQELKRQVNNFKI